MEQVDYFFSEKEYIEIDGFDSFIRFVRYNPDIPEIFLDNLELYDDLTNKFGTILYARGTIFSSKHLMRLLQLRETSPDLDLTFKIIKNAKLIQTFRDDVKNHCVSLIRTRQDIPAFKHLFSRISVNIESFIDEILTQESITLVLFKYRYMRDTLNANKSSLFLEHSLNVALVSLAIASSEIYANIIGKDRVKLIAICKTGLLHNYGALTKLEDILKLPVDKWFEQYWQTNYEAFSLMDNLQISPEISKAVNLINEYYAGNKKDFIKSENLQSVIANIVLVADFFISKETGLFGEAQPVKKVVDQLNIMVSKGEFSEKPVKALTKGLNLLEIFNFYKVLDSVTRKCPYKSGIPYPLVGFNSAILYICKKSIAKCKYLDVTRKAVNFVKQSEELKPGNYYRCKLLTKMLQDYYKEHYRDIKDIVKSGNN